MWFGIGSFAACTSIGLHFNWTTIGSVLFGSQLPRFCEVRAVASSSMNPLQGLLFVQCWLIKVERDTFCQEILMHRMLEGHLPNVPIFDDVESFKGTPWIGEIDGITAGFPCQVLLSCLYVEVLDPVLLICIPSVLLIYFRWQGSSKAGKRLGVRDPRTGLVCHLFRILDESAAQLVVVVFHCSLQHQIMYVKPLCGLGAFY